jgi:hypothetical protein
MPPQDEGTNSSVVRVYNKLKSRLDEFFVVLMYTQLQQRNINNYKLFNSTTYYMYKCDCLTQHRLSSLLDIIAHCIKASLVLKTCSTIELKI